MDTCFATYQNHTNGAQRNEAPLKELATFLHTKAVDLHRSLRARLTGYVPMATKGRVALAGSTTWLNESHL